MKADFEDAIQAHFDAKTRRDLEVFRAHLTTRKTLYTIVQNGHAFTTPEETIAIHKQWLQDPNWIWEGSVVHKVVGEDVAMALVKYKYRAKPFTTRHRFGMPLPQLRAGQLVAQADPRRGGPLSEASGPLS